MRSWHNTTKRVVHWRKRLVWNFNLGRMVKHYKWGSGKEPSMPMIGFVCHKCNIFGPYDHWLIEGENVCAPCAEKYFQDPRGSK